VSFSSRLLVLVLCLAGSILASCDEVTGPHAWGHATIDTVVKDFPRHVAIDESRLPERVDATMGTSDGNETIEVDARVSASSTVAYCSQGATSITYRAAGRTYRADSLDGDCRVIVKVGTSDHEGFVTMSISGTLVDPTTGGTSTLSNAHLSISNLH